MENGRSTNTVGRRLLHLELIQTQEMSAEAIWLKLFRILITAMEMKKSVCSRHTWRHSSGPKLLNRKGGKQRKLSGSRTRL